MKLNKNSGETQHCIRAKGHDIREQKDFNKKRDIGKKSHTLKQSFIFFPNKCIKSYWLSLARTSNSIREIAMISEQILKSPCSLCNHQ